MSKPFAWFKFDKNGAEIDRYLPGQAGLSANDHRAAGRIPVSIPRGYPYDELISARRNPDGRVVMEWPAYLRDWVRFWRAISGEPMYKEAIAGGRVSPPLGLSISLFALALTALKTDGATPEEFTRLQQLWEVLRADILAGTFPQSAPQEIVDRLLAIATSLNINLEAG
ncbi:MAG: hypothetical protein ACFCA4_12645 [Cyanophyceae cyanobacterium]